MNAEKFAVFCVEDRLGVVHTYSSSAGSVLTDGI